MRVFSTAFVFSLTLLTTLAHADPLTNIWHDVTQGPGPNNRLVGPDGLVQRPPASVARSSCLQ